jgi:hypothetical protein
LPFNRFSSIFRIIRSCSQHRTLQRVEIFRKTPEIVKKAKERSTGILKLPC